MIQWFSKKLKNRKGFTLIELIVVIAILGILALVAIPRFVGLTTRAEEKADAATAVTLKNAALVAYYDTRADATPPTINLAYFNTGDGAGKYLAPDFDFEYSDGVAITALGVADGVVTLTPDRENDPSAGKP